MANFGLGSTLLETNPLNAQLRKVLDKPKSKSFTSPLRNLETHLGRPRAKIETIAAWVAPPWRSPAVNNNNPDQTSYESATARYAESRDQHLNLFADGSVTHSKAGIGITVYLEKATPLTTYSRLIKQNGEIDSTVVELVAIREAVTLVGTLLDIINRRGTSVPQVSIWSDSQTAIRMVTRQETGSGATIVQGILRAVNYYSILQGRLAIQWIPNKAAIPGHVEADRQAKLATNSTVAQPDLHNPMPDSATHEWHMLRDRILAKARQRQWSTGRSLLAIDSALPGRHIAKLYDKLNKKEASILSQLRTGHARLNRFLAKINVTESGQCECGQGEEIVRHFVLFCPR